MGDDQLPSLPSERLPGSPASMEDLINEFVAGKQETTRAEYRRDIALFGTYLGVTSAEEVAKRLFGNGPTGANRLALAYRASLLDRGLSSSRINRMLASLRALVDFAQTVGVVPWQLKIKNVKAEKVKDDLGPSVDGFVALLREAKQQVNPVLAARDPAILWLLFSPALRENEVVSLRLDDIEAEQNRLFVLAKGKRKRHPLPLPGPTLAALQTWIDVRGRAPGPLFSGTRVGKREPAPLTRWALIKIVGRLGRKCGMKVWPHGIRHAGVTAALDRAPIREVQRFSRHANIQTLLIYDDSREDFAKKVATLAANAVQERMGAEITAAVAPTAPTEEKPAEKSS